VPLGRHVFGVRYARTGTVQNSHTPLGDLTLFVDDEKVGTLADVMTHPGTFGLAGAGITVGRNGGSGVSSRYKAPFTFTGGTIAQVTVDFSGRPYEDVERELALAFSRD
jgi:arylsulfatase